MPLQGSGILNGLKQTELLSVHGALSWCGPCCEGLEAGCQSKYIPKSLNFFSPSTPPSWRGEYNAQRRAGAPILDVCCLTRIIGPAPPAPAEDVHPLGTCLVLRDRKELRLSPRLFHQSLHLHQCGQEGRAELPRLQGSLVHCASRPPRTAPH